MLMLHFWLYAISQGLEKKIESCTDDEAVAKYNVIKVTADSMIESVKHAIVMMQLAKVWYPLAVINQWMFW